MQSLKRAARCSLKIQDTKNHHLCTIAQLCQLHLRDKGTYRQLERNLLSSNICSRCPYNMANLRPLAAEIGPVVWGAPANFNWFRVLAALLHSTLVVGVSQTLRVEQRTPPIFGKAAITLGIGPHF